MMGQKETSRTCCKHGRHLYVCGQYREHSNSKSSTASSPSQLEGVLEGMLEFGVPMGQCFSRFPTVSPRSRGGGGGEEEGAG